MDRLPFDPDKTSAAKKARQAPRADKASPITVSELAALIDGALKDRVPTGLKVAGELSGFSDRTHWYFTLKDENAVIAAVMFASAAAKCRFHPANGQRVIASGRVEFFGKQGRTQLYVSSLEPLGLGDLEQRLRALIEELRALGWLDAARKRPLPAFPRRIAVVTSRTGAALQDVIDTARRRCPAVDLAVVDVRVQGDGAASEVAAAVTWLSAHHEALGVDAVIVTRGGGSMEDLWAFNEREVAQAVLHCAVPVVAAIGHETDTTLVELVADERAATPTQAAMRLTPDRSALGEQASQLGARALSTMQRLLRDERRRLAAATRRPAAADPRYTLAHASDLLRRVAARLAWAASGRAATRRASLERLGARLARHEPRGVYAQRRAALDSASHRLDRAVRHRLAPAELRAANDRLWKAWAAASERRSAALSSLDRELTIAGPASVLSRGYSMTMGPGGELIRRVAEVSPGHRLTTRVGDGSFTSTVEGDVSSSPPLPIGPGGAAPPLAPRRRPQRARTLPPKDQMNLF